MSRLVVSCGDHELGLIVVITPPRPVHRLETIPETRGSHAKQTLHQKTWDGVEARGVA